MIVTVGRQSLGKADGASMLVSASGETLGSVAFAEPLAPGPYFGRHVGGALQLFATYRLYPDVNRVRLILDARLTMQAFQSGVIQRADGSFANLASSIPSHPTARAIAVPSRLYFPAPTPDRPLSGLRISIKDSIDIRGVKSTQGSRVWEQLYPPASRTAPAVQRLIDLGAVIVGKTRLSQFAHGSRAGLGDDVDFSRPINPRADGDQDPSSSSSGAGVSVAAYECTSAVFLCLDVATTS